uniref:Rab-like protein n=1 Tax=Trepomonas sp. PC1 TaxID=1076344 RepID=A0A146K7K2_9EUKA|eukprot:JAP91576.1 Rab-like protein [Trepomonas sp. PC1]
MFRSKTVMVGSISTGKSSLIHRLIDNQFDSNVTSTTGALYYKKSIKLSNADVQLNIWDTAGQETWCNSVGTAYYRGTDAVVFVYDVTQATSLQNIQKWYKNFIETETSKSHPMFLVGNKIDKPNTETPDSSVKQILQLLKIADDRHFRCSAKNGQNVKELFKLVAYTCCNECQLEVVEATENFVIQQPTEIKKKGGCC